jgi:hypothetical protein
VPKSERVIVRQDPEPSQSEGASATHSADEVSGRAIRVTFVTCVPRVTFTTRRVTFVPSTVTMP